MERQHIPILVEEILDFMMKSGGAYADLTFGEGGHSEQIMTRGAESLLGVDRDPSAIETYRKEGALKDDPRLSLWHGPYSEALKTRANNFDGILIDLGVSTRQILSQTRGFSFEGDGPLDMRMDSSSSRTLKSVLEEISDVELRDALIQNADIPNSGRVARLILNRFREGKLQSTADLARIMGPRRGKTHPATSLFMGLRMLVNDELGEIERGLPLAIDALKPGGRLCVITFHSIEDRIVKRLFLKLAGRCICDARICACPRKEIVKILTSKPIVPSDAEVERNPRSRSAKLRVIEKI